MNRTGTVAITTGSGRCPGRVTRPTRRPSSSVPLEDAAGRQLPEPPT
ncbi:hypothetical protein [Geodermatophilus nigrescens]